MPHPFVCRRLHLIHRRFPMFQKLKRILALFGAILLAGMYLITIILAFMDHTASKDWLMASVICTIVIPCFLYAYILIYRYLKK